MATPELQVNDTALLTNILQEAVFTAQEKSIAGQLYTVYDMTGTPGLTSQIPVYPSISASAPAQTDDLSDTAVALSTVTIAATEIGARVDVSDLLAESTARNMGSDVGVMLGNAIAEKIDTDAFALFTQGNLSQIVGDAAAEVTPDTILQAVYTLRNQNAPTDADGDYIAVLHPGQAFNVAKVLANAGYASSGAAASISNLGNQILSSSAFVGKIFNVKLFQSSVIAADSVTTAALGCVFSPSAFGHVLKRPLRIEAQRDASFRKTEYVASTARGNGVIKSNYGVLIQGNKVIS